VSQGVDVCPLLTKASARRERAGGRS